jgi:hypothetical protein
VLDEERLAGVDAAVRELADDLRSGRPADDVSVPPLAELPHTAAQIARLRHELSED